MCWCVVADFGAKRNRLSEADWTSLPSSLEQRLEWGQKAEWTSPLKVEE